MADEPDSLILAYLRRIDEKVDRLADTVRDLTVRSGLLEQRFALLEQQFANLSVRLDRVEARLDRIERRLDLLPAAE